jgi:transcriptional regulator with XRE-family HTH domain
MTARFDNEAFFAALNAERLSRRLNWKEVSEKAGVQASTITRMGQGKKPDVNSLAALLAWSNLKTEMFVRGAGDAESLPLAQITALLRADPTLTPQKARVLENIIHTTYETLRDT